MADTFKDKFNAAKDAAGLTLKQIADEVGRSEAAVYFWSTGATKRPDDKALPKLAKMFGMKPEQLLPKGNGTPAPAPAKRRHVRTQPLPQPSKPPRTTPLASTMRPAGGVSAAPVVLSPATEAVAQPLLASLAETQAKLSELRDALSRPLSLDGDTVAALAQRIALEVADRMGSPALSDPVMLRLAALERRLDAIEGRAALPVGPNKRRA